MLSLEEKIGRMLMVGFHGHEAPDYILRWLAEGRINGVILFARNVKSPEQLARLTQMCHEAAGRPIFISIDQEGGTVARLTEGFTESPGAMPLGVAGSDKMATDTARVLATELRALGINWNYAPVVDVTHDISNPSVGVRSVGTDPEQVAYISAAQVRGFQSESVGVAATAKHFPGIGNTPVDTHEALAVISGPVDYLWQNDLIPFRAAVEAGVATVMVSHVKFETLDAEYPATLSPIIVNKLLREDIGFDGVTTTDCMEMRAITDHYGAGESAVLAALAGIDMILFSHTRAYQEAAYDALVEAARSGRLSESRIDQAISRLDVLLDRFAITSAPDLNLIRDPENLRIMEAAARAGTVLLKSNDGTLPLDASGGRKIALVEFASVIDSQVMETGGQTGLVAVLSKRLPMVEAVSLLSVDPNPEHLKRAEKLADESDVLILATRNAHLIPPQLERAQNLVERAKSVILLCLRNPFDAEVLHGTDVILCTCGDSAPSVEAAVAALLGDFAPTGHLPVSVKVASV